MITAGRTPGGALPLHLAIDETDTTKAVRYTDREGSWSSLLSRSGAVPGAGSSRLRGGESRPAGDDGGGA